MNFFDVVFQFFWSSLSGIMLVSDILIDIFSNIGNYLIWLPSTVSGIVTVGVIVAILFQILGR